MKNGYSLVLFGLLLAFFPFHIFGKSSDNPEVPVLEQTDLLSIDVTKVPVKPALVRQPEQMPIIVEHISWQAILDHQLQIAQLESVKDKRKMYFGVGVLTLVAGYLIASNTISNIYNGASYLAHTKDVAGQFHALLQPAKQTGGAAPQSVHSTGITPLSWGQAFLYAPIAFGKTVGSSVAWSSSKLWGYVLQPALVMGLSNILLTHVFNRPLAMLADQINNKNSWYWWMKAATSLSDFMKVETKFKTSFDYILFYSASLDLYSPRLNLEMQQNQHQQFLQMLTEDLSKAAQTKNNSYAFMLSDLLANKRKLYESQAADLQNMHHQAQMLITQKRKVDHQQEAYVSGQTDFYKKQLATQLHIVNNDVQTIMGFVLSRTTHSATWQRMITDRLQNTMALANEYIDRMNELLTYDQAILYEKGKLGVGLFDTAFDYYQMLNKEFTWYATYIS